MWGGIIGFIFGGAVGVVIATLYLGLVAFLPWTDLGNDIVGRFPLLGDLYPLWWLSGWLGWIPIASIGAIFGGVIGALINRQYSNRATDSTDK